MGVLYLSAALLMCVYAALFIYSLNDAVLDPFFFPEIAIRSLKIDIISGYSSNVRPAKNLFQFLNAKRRPIRLFLANSYHTR